MVLGGCSSSAKSHQGAPDSGARPSSSTTTTAPGPVPTFTGSGDFYKVPDPLPKGEPGALIRVQPVSDGNGLVVLRVMYHSRDTHDHDRAVTGTISYPTETAPSGGWPVLAWDHGTSGLSASCAPSRGNSPPPAFGVKGVVAATDYLGLGPDGELHPYLNRLTEARATVDSVRAARNITGAHAGKRWVVVGHSQGGHASLSTGELAPGYGAELDLLGTVAIAPAAELTTVIPGEAPLVSDIVLAMGLYGQQAADPAFDPDRYLSEAAQKVKPLIDAKCLPDIQNFLVSVVATGGQIYDHNPRQDPAGMKLLQANEVGTVKTASPLLVISGGKDPLVVEGRVDAFVKRACKSGDRVQRIDLANENHGTEPAVATPQIKQWVDARFAGEPAPSTC